MVAAVEPYDALVVVAVNEEEVLAVASEDAIQASFPALLSPPRLWSSGAASP